MKDSFVIYTKYEEQISLLTDTQAGILLRALICYQSGKELPKMDGIVNMIFTVIRQQIDYDNQRYDDICDINKENGKKGGRPLKSRLFKGKEPKKPTAFQNEEEKPTAFLGFEEKPKKASGLEKEKNPPKKERSKENSKPQKKENTPPISPQGGEGEDFQKKFFSVYCQFKKFSMGSYPNIDFEKLLFEFDKSAQLRKTFSWQVILDSYDGIIAGNFRDKVDEIAARRELMADRERWYTERRNAATDKAEKIYKRFMQDETFKGIEKRLKELLPKIARAELESENGSLKAKESLVKLTQEQGELKQQRLAIIERNGMSEEDLLPQWHCKKCQDTGYLASGKACDCYKGD